MKRQRASWALMGSLLVVLMGTTLAHPAHAKLVEIWGSGLVGGGYGDGNSDKDFYRWVRGGATGVEVGAKVLFLGGFIDYLRWFGGKEGANLLTLNLGGDYDVGLTDSFSIVVRGAAGYYIGTLPDGATTTIGTVKVDQVNTRGVGARLGIGPRMTFAQVFSVGITPELGYHYFFGGAKTDITENNSSGYDFTVLAYLRLGLGF